MMVLSVGLILFQKLCSIWPASISNFNPHTPKTLRSPNMSSDTDPEVIPSKIADVQDVLKVFLDHCNDLITEEIGNERTSTNNRLRQLLINFVITLNHNYSTTLICS